MPQVNLRMTPNDRDRIQRLADRAGCSLSEYMRRCAGLNPADCIACASGGRHTSATIRAILEVAEALADQPGRHNPDTSAIAFLSKVEALLAWLRDNPYHPDAPAQVATVFEALPDDVREALKRHAAELHAFAKA